MITNINIEHEGNVLKYIINLKCPVCVSYFSRVLFRILDINKEDLKYNLSEVDPFVCPSCGVLFGLTPSDKKRILET